MVRFGEWHAGLGTLMMRWVGRAVALCVTAWLVWVGGATAAETAKPNVLFICVDDLKPVLGCYGDKHAITPNVDRLARRGVLFERAYCNQAVCAPSRNALMTGLRPQTVGIYDLSTHFRVATPDAITLAQHFQKQGYRTEAMGKIFHVGHGNREDAASWSVPHVQAKTVDYALKENQGPSREAALFNNKMAFGLPKGAATESADVPDTTFGDGQIAEEAIRRLRSAKGTGTPFFIAVGFLRPHLPFVAPKKYWDLYDPAKLPQPERQTAPDGAPGYAPQFGGELRQYAGIPDKGPIDAATARHLIHGYYASVSYMDAQLGRVLDALDEAGLSDSTIITLWGDHGWHLGDHGMWCKHTNYEEAARIPFIVAVPKGPAGAKSNAFIESVDIFPTMAELAGLPAPAGIDGKSFAKVVADPAAKFRDHIVHVYPRGQRLGRAIRTDRYRMVEWKKPGAPADTAEFELYDYEADPDETRNLAKAEPQVLAELRAILVQHPEAKAQVHPPAKNGERQPKPGE